MYMCGMIARIIRRIFKPTMCLIGIYIIFTYIYNQRCLLSKRNTILLRIQEWNNMNCNNTKLKFILQWNHKYFPCEIDEDGFLRNVCNFTNCVITRDRYLLNNVTQYDAIFFYHGYAEPISNSDLPEIRSPHQKYVFAAQESSHNYPLCSDRLEGTFNWTWTYKLDSDGAWSYFLVKDSNGTVVGPNKIMHWMKIEDMEPVNETYKAQLRSKSKTAAWFVSNCDPLSGRQRYAEQLEIQLAKYNLTLDIYGKCGPYKCDDQRDFLSPGCDELISKHYYFYLAFENSLSEDYVTEKVLRPLLLDSVPVVYGYANYTRFMPDGIYLNAYEQTPDQLAVKMNHLIHNPEEYYNYFKWKNHYSYHWKCYNFCRICAMLNDEDWMRKQTVKRNFSQWWDVPKRCDIHQRLRYVITVAIITLFILIPYPFLYYVIRLR